MRPHNNTGFTLVELMVTVAVTGILLAVAVPAFQSTLDKRRLIGAAEQLYTDLQYARSEAIKLNLQVNVIFSTSTSTSTNWCYGMTTLATCACGTLNDCQLNGVEKVVSASGFRGVTLVPGTIFGGSDTYFEPRHGLSDNGRAAFSSSFGTINVIVSNLGRVSICSTSSGLGQYKPAGNAC